MVSPWKQLMKRNTRSRRLALKRPRDILFDRARALGCILGSLGDYESLAGVDIKSPGERHALWYRFSHLFTGESQGVIDAVMDHCATIALERLDRGELCLLGPLRPSQDSAAVQCGSA